MEKSLLKETYELFCHNKYSKYEQSYIQSEQWFLGFADEETVI